MKKKVFTQNEIIELIDNGKVIVIYKRHVLNLSSWIYKHPGGRLSIQHMIGKDATDQMNAYHSFETCSHFFEMSIGVVDYDWKNLIPPLHKLAMKKTQLLNDYNEKFVSKNISDVNLKTNSPVVLSFQNNHPSQDENKNKLSDPQRLIKEINKQNFQKSSINVPYKNFEFQNIVKKKFNELHQNIIEQGLYECNYYNYYRELFRISSLFLCFIIFLKLKFYFLSALALAFVWHQLSFVAHDLGHLSFTHNYLIDNLVGIFFTSFFGGLSLLWWKENHNIHHLLTNNVHHDPDIQHIPFLAVSINFVNNIYSTFYDKLLSFDVISKCFIKVQNYLYYPIMLFGRFNLYRLSIIHLIKNLSDKKRNYHWFLYFEFVNLVCFFYWYFYLVIFRSITSWKSRILYFIVSNSFTALLHVQITLSHFAMSTSEINIDESFFSRQIRTSMDVDCPEWLDFLHGGLQFQVVHHLFPRLPRHNLRLVQKQVITLCNDLGFKYSIYGFMEGNNFVLSKLKEVANQCQLFLAVSKAHTKKHSIPT